MDLVNEVLTRRTRKENRTGVDTISAFRIALFNITSILTGTGYTSSNFSNW